MLGKKSSLLETSSSHPAVKLERKLFSEVIQSFIQLQIANKAWKAKDLKEHTDFYNQFVKLFTRSLCPDCAQKAYDELDEWRKKNRGKLVVHSRQAVEHSLGCDRPLGARTVGNFRVFALTAISPFVKLRSR